MLFKTKSKGFTIIEMMIALSIFSVVVLLTSAIVSGLAKQYQKAVYSARLNEASRTVNTLLSDSISYSSSINIDYIGLANQTVFGYFCAGDSRYFWHKQTGTSLGSDTGLYKDNVAIGVCSAPASVGTAENLLPKNGFVTDLSLVKVPSTNLYKITTVFKVGTYGMFNIANSDIADVNTVCLSTFSGGDFCAQNSYSSIIVQKVGGNI